MLLISDLHLTDKETDRYRFEIFTEVAKYYNNTGDKNLIILGDLTDSKDHHSAALVNAIVTRLQDLAGRGMEIFILMGNHDYIDPGLPYFDFLNHFEYVTFIKKPQQKMIQGLTCQFLPHTRNPQEEWKALKPQVGIMESEFVFMHQSVIGAMASNGFELEGGLPPKYFRHCRGKVISGDIHMPQTVGKVEYVGTPYSVKFNDHYQGRMLSIDNSGTVEFIYPNIMNRWTFEIETADDLQTCAAEPGDQVKLRVVVSRAEYESWPQRKADIVLRCKELDYDLRGLQMITPPSLPLRKQKNKLQEAYNVLLPKQVLAKYSAKKNVDKSTRRVGRRILNEITED